MASDGAPCKGIEKGHSVDTHDQLVRDIVKQAVDLMKETVEALGNVSDDPEHSLFAYEKDISEEHLASPVSLISIPDVDLQVKSWLEIARSHLASTCTILGVPQAHFPIPSVLVLSRVSLEACASACWVLSPKIRWDHRLQRFGSVLLRTFERFDKDLGDDTLSGRDREIVESVFERQGWQRCNVPCYSDLVSNLFDEMLPSDSNMNVYGVLSKAVHADLVLPPSHSSSGSLERNREMASVYFSISLALWVQVCSLLASWHKLNFPKTITESLLGLVNFDMEWDGSESDLLLEEGFSQEVINHYYEIRNRALQ